ncbi:hypothetical protein PHYBLDRAFT_148631 [Phycomyces blakesleeanus NRRL 1555(-)]|uniref:C2H2-type zinc finger transcription factor n=1 Tax=Phycomyces blakesleeanus (strain ATCC 8743b / DSM 1359 / FGSC 10004 / NBRC 33097 / NRRL 1555) TaxID=763407 RepID=A0A162NIT4_PHYB8|nr:hypothetical protein PHYBLDRAFT_148631 [Phycomyces blakesleeanus NRRL 1555(-)]OAD70064.1 hypothetical protein PHYBLDRAFT_148631 [Phycomyces blakesleeanus NRRL 1555(-)]|eukprot:XP_018288104.1 hypothetical protein PHYBLDRAFT_148631 [Phycomyces blakesleeanus NRRL 1555(-)]
MPGPKEPKTDEINNYLRPLVDELLQLYFGIHVPTYKHPAGTWICTALLMIACDIPAARKTSGFTAHNSTHACYKCNKQFPCLKGSSASQLYRLGYFNLVRGTIIDPMHNLFLGTAKRMVEKWIKENNISPAALATMQKTSESMVLSANYTILRSKIGKALLKNILPQHKLKNWIDFVNACHLLVKPSITMSEINKAHDYLQSFCQQCLVIYKPGFLTCNMHLHLHLHETINDFRPVYDGFEATYMKTFINDAYKGGYMRKVLTCPSLVPFIPLLQKLTSSATTTANYDSYVSYAPLSRQNFQLQQFVNIFLCLSPLTKGNEPLPPSSFPLCSLNASTMSDIDYPQLLHFYQLVYANPDIVSYHNASLCPYFVDNQITKLKSINLLGQIYKGKNSSGNCGSFVQAMFLGSNNITKTALTGQIQYLFIHSFTPPPHPNSPVSQVHQKKHIFAYIRWLSITADKRRKTESIDVYLPNFMPDNYHSILPVHRIDMEVATATRKARNNIKKTTQKQKGNSKDE